MAGFLKRIKAKATAVWENKIASRLSGRTRKYIGLLSIPGAVLKVAAVVAAGASVMHILGPYILGVAIVTTTSMAALIVRDVIRARRTVEWQNAAGQTVRSSRLAREDLRDIQKKLKKHEAAGGRHDAEALRLASHFSRFAGKVDVLRDAPDGNGAFRFAFRGGYLPA